MEKATYTNTRNNKSVTDYALDAYSLKSMLSLKSGDTIVVTINGEVVSRLLWRYGNLYNII